MAVGDTINTSTLTLTFDDEFNTFTSSADGSTGLWRTSLMNGSRTLGNNGEKEYYSDSSVGVNPFTLSNGVLNIMATPGSNALGLPYNSGVITTENSFNQLYGYFEIDAKMPAGQGLWPAFWLLPASGAWPPELDAFEVLGNDPTKLYFSTHSKVQATQGTTLNVANVSSGFNKYGVMWGPKTVDLYINGVEVASMPTPADMNVPMYMLANLAVGGYWPGDPNSSTVFPADMQINYVHAYAYPGTTGGKVYDTTAAQNIGAAPLAPVISVPSSATVPSYTAAALKGVSFASNWPGGFFTVQIGDTSGKITTGATTDVFTTGEGSNYLTLQGNLAPLNAALATMTYTGPGSEWVWITITDPQGLKSTESIDVSHGNAVSLGGISSNGTAPSGTTTPVSTPATTPASPPATSSGGTPSVTAPATLNIAPKGQAAIAGVSVANVNSGTVLVRVSDSTGLLSTNAVAGVTVSGEGSTSLSLSGTETAVNMELTSLNYMAGSATGSDWLWVSANVPGAAQGLSHVVVDVGGTAAAAPTSSPTPVITTPGNLFASANAAQAVKGVSIADGGYTGDITVAVSDNTGLLNTTRTSGVTENGEGSTTLSLSGSVAAVDAELTSLTYTAGASAATGWLWISAQAAAGGDTKGIGHIVMNTTMAASTAPVAATAAPVVHTPTAVTLPTGAARALGGISIADSGETGTIAVAISDATGLLNIGTTGVSVQGETSHTLTLTGSVAAVNADLAGLTYTPGASGTSDWLWVSARNPDGRQGLNHTVVDVSAGGMITSIGGSGQDTITALAANQTLTGGTGIDTLIGYAGFGDTFLNTAAGLNGDTIKYFGGSDLIDITNLASGKASLSYAGNTNAGTLSISETGAGVVDTITFTSGTNLSASLFHMTSNGHGGVYIG